MAQHQLPGKRIGRSVATEPQDADPTEPHADPTGLIVDPAKERIARDSFAKENDWLKLAVSWSPETRATLVMDFIRDRSLYHELVQFARKRKR